MALQQRYESEVWDHSSNGCFDCNICLDSSHDPVVTLCGHLYCWPCIYKWLKVQNSSFGSYSNSKSKCPVCKSHITTESLVPLYGRGTSDVVESKKARLDMTVPGRPPALRTNAVLSQQSHQNPFQSQNRALSHQYLPHPMGGYASSGSLYSPTINMVGEFVFARMFGSSDTNAFGYPYSSYHHSFSGSPRVRRREMQMEKSLNRVSIFLFCCLILCLALF